MRFNSKIKYSHETLNDGNQTEIVHEHNLYLLWKDSSSALLIIDKLGCGKQDNLS